MSLINKEQLLLALNRAEFMFQSDRLTAIEVVESMPIDNRISAMQASIDTLRAKAMLVDENHRGSLYYAILDLADKYGTHSTGDYFKGV